MAMTVINTNEAKRDEGGCQYKVQESHCFAVEAKMGCNDWRSIEEVYPEIELASLYLHFNDAKYAKGRLKGLLLGAYKNQFKKRPIRIRKFSQYSEY